MTSTIGAQGLLDMSGEADSTDLKNIVETAAAPVSASISGTAPSTDVSPLVGDTVPIAVTNAAGIGEYTMTANARYPKAAAKYGSDGLVTASGLDLGRVSSYTVTLNCQEYEDTALASTPPTFKGFIPGEVSGTWSLETNIDDTTALPEVGDTATGATFRLSTASTNDNEISGDIIVTGVTPNVSRGEKNTATVSGVFTGELSAAGDESLFTGSTVARPQDTDFILKPDAATPSSVTYAGTVFWTSIAISVNMNQPIDIALTMRGTGALVHNS